MAQDPIPTYLAVAKKASDAIAAGKLEEAREWRALADSVVDAVRCDAIPRPLDRTSAAAVALEEALETVKMWTEGAMVGYEDPLEQARSNESYYREGLAAVRAVIAKALVDEEPF